MTNPVPTVLRKMEPGADPVLAIPARLNIALAFLSMTGAAACLWIASQSYPWGIRLGAAVAFSFVNNTVFSLLHEAVHGTFHSSPGVNAFFGRWLAAFFPTSFSLQRFFHLGHHRRNRTPAERFDYIAPNDNVFQKNVQWYGILTGLYWFLPPLSCLIYLVAPGALISGFIHSEEAAWSHQSGTSAMLEGVDRLRRPVIACEIAFILLWQASLFYFLGLSPSGWCLCYGAFALNWSSLQYADHAWSPLHVTQGAWNLKVNRWVQALFLNYHHHRAHHENPTVSWIHLSHFVDPREPRPSFWRIYLSMWKGPRRLPSAYNEGSGEEGKVG